MTIGVVLISAFVALYALNVNMCVLYHIKNKTPYPETDWEFIKLTFGPYVIYKEYKEKRNG